MITACAFLLAGAALAGAEPPSARAVIERAVAAHGGAAALGEESARVARGAVRVRWRGDELAGTLVLTTRGEKWRRELTITLRGTSFDLISTWDGADAWRLVRGRAAEMPAEPYAIEAAHRPEAVLLRALESAGSATLTDAGGETSGPAIVELGAGPARERLAFDRETGLLQWVEYEFPENEGLAEVKRKLRRDSWSDWRPFGSAGLVAWRRETTRDGALTESLVLESVEARPDLDDSAFSLADLDETPRPADEMAD